MVFNATFNNISAILWQSVLLVEETGGPGENNPPVEENNLQKVGQSFVHLYRRPTVIQDLLVRRQFSLVPDNWTNVDVKA
jgi:hypothetical protein